MNEMCLVFQRLYGGDNGEDKLHTSLSVAIDRQSEPNIADLP